MGPEPKGPYILTMYSICMYPEGSLESPKRPNGPYQGPTLLTLDSCASRNPKL